LAAVALFLFVVTIVLIIWQPGGLPVGWTAAGGALLALAAGVVDPGDVGDVAGIVWNATLALVAVMLISLVLEKAGFFEWAALHMAWSARGNGLRMFLLIVALGSAVSALFTNDGGILIMTPIVLAMVRALDFDARTVIPFVMATGFIADTTSLPLVISNLVNIISADFFGIGFAEYASRMIVPNLVSAAASLLVLYLYFRKGIPARYDTSRLKTPKEAILDPRMFRWAWVVLGIMLLALFAGEALGVPESALVGAAAVLLLAIARKSPVIDVRQVVREAPWSIVVFSIGMYVVVYGLRNAGLTDMLSRLIEHAAGWGWYAATVAMGLLAAVLSSAMNNLPAVMIGAIAVSGTDTGGFIREALVYANVIGSDLGPKMTPIGSLATLLWLHVLAAKQVKIGWGSYVKAGVVLTVPTLLAALSGLAAWLYAIHELRWNAWLAIALIAAVFAALALVRSIAKAAKAHSRKRRHSVPGR
jgi:arsenical pump membrane protein